MSDAEAIRFTQKKYGSAALILAIFSAMLLIVIGQKPMAKGLILGTLFSVLNFVLMGQVLPMLIGKTRRASTAYALGSITFRFGVMAVPLILSLKTTTFHFAAVVIGLFMIQIVIFGDYIRRHFIKGALNAYRKQGNG